MSSTGSKKRAASPTGSSRGPKRQHTTTPPEEDNSISSNDEADDSPIETSSRAVAEYYPDHYAAANGEASPRLPSEMSEEQQLAVAVARFRPLNGPLPPGFDVESLPIYRTPVSHLNVPAGWTRPALLATDPEEPQGGVETAVGPVDGLIGVDATPEDQTCHWASCTKTFTGFNGPTLLWLHLTNEHVERPVLDGGCKWANCAYSNTNRRFLVSHVGTHVPAYKPLVCDECGRGFQQPAHLVSHQRTHR